MVAKDISFSAPFLNSLTPDLLGMAVESRLSRSSKWRPSQTWFHFRYFFPLSLCLRMRNGNESKEEDFLPSGKISMMLIGAAGINLEAILRLFLWPLGYTAKEASYIYRNKLYP